jgi:hypothetical protein
VPVVKVQKKRTQLLAEDIVSVDAAQSISPPATVSCLPNTSAVAVAEVVLAQKDKVY